MANICVEIETTRDISRQLLRHRSFHFQEFSQRYAAVDQEEPVVREARLQDEKNRQNSIVTESPALQAVWSKMQSACWDVCYAAYKTALERGIAKEQARALLPEGLTKTKMYMNGTVRDWFHYLSVRMGPETQLEHRLLAWGCLDICREVLPDVFNRLVTKDE